MIIRAKAVSQDIKLSRTVGPRGPQEKPVWLWAMVLFCSKNKIKHIIWNRGKVNTRSAYKMGRIRIVVGMNFIKAIPSLIVVPNICQMSEESL